MRPRPRARRRAPSPPPADAPLPGSCFEAYDGDQADSDASAGPRLDWAGVKNTPGFSTGLDYTVGSKDSQFGPGGSELAPDGWTFDLGTLGSDKYNVFSAWNYREPVPTSDLYLGLSFTRESNNGATYLAFELNQKLPGYRTATETTSNRTIKVPTRSSGDLLITYDVDNNDLTPRIGVCVWSGDEHSGTWTDGNGTNVGASCPEVTPSVVQAAMNAAAITAPDNALSGVPLAIGQFGEAAINLPAALRALAHSTLPTNPCVSFGYAWIHSRSSPSITSNQQDYILPSDPISVANCSVTGRKINDLDGSGTVGAGEGGLGGFTFYADYDNDGVKDSGEPFDVSAPRDANDLRPAGTYTITGLNPGTLPDPRGRAGGLDVHRAVAVQLPDHDGRAGRGRQGLPELPAPLDQRHQVRGPQRRRLAPAGRGRPGRLHLLRRPGRQRLRRVRPAGGQRRRRLVDDHRPRARRLHGQGAGQGRAGRARTPAARARRT